jgi:hypothetical protein
LTACRDREIVDKAAVFLQGGDGMATRADLQPLINWCKKPPPADAPNLKRVVDAQLVKSDDDFRYFEGSWLGFLRYRGGRSGFLKGDGFVGVLTSDPYYTEKAPTHAVMLIALGDDDVWASVEGPFVPPELEEDVSLDVFEADPPTGWIGANLAASPNLWLWLSAGQRL